MIGKLILMAVAATWLGACSMGSQVGKVEDHALDTAAVVQRVNDIYTDVFQHYELMASPDWNRRLTGIKPPAVKFCTRDWNDLVTQVTSFDATNVPDGQMGFFDADYWIMGQDWGDLKVSDVQVKAMTDTTATVELNLHNLGSATTVRLEMLQERDDWRIDNFIDLTHDIDWKANMKEYLSGEMANQ